ncbi:MAG: hypothetical protein AAGN66_20855 [Acidobacteriota bacterium]
MHVRNPSILLGLGCLLLLSAAGPAAGQIAPAEELCVIGLSKDFGAMRLNNGSWNQLGCQLPGVASCRTLSGRDVSAGGFFSADGALCTNNSTCDEAPDLDGRFIANVDINVRLQDPCPVRGDWRGSFRLLDAATQSVVLATGSLDATLGVGTHREDVGGPNCERCSVARFDTTLQRWLIDSEGFLQGKVIKGTYAGCELRASFQGQLNANGDVNGPTPPNYNWGFEGKLDGVLLCPCQ